MSWEDIESGGGWDKIEEGTRHPINAVEDHASKRRRAAEAYLHTFKEGTGAVVLADLSHLLDGELFDADAKVTAYNLGARSVLLRIRKRMDEARKPPSA